MLLNKIFCLDKGYVALVDSCCETQKLADLRDEFFGAVDNNELYRRLGTMVLVIKCPLFVASSLLQFRFNVVTVPVKEAEAYIPHQGDIKSGDLETDKAIADDIFRTTEALLINPKAYQADKCDKFISQVITPISVYTTLIVSGSYNQWRQYCETKGLPELMEVYQDAVKQILTAEWRDA